MTNTDNIRALISKPYLWPSESISDFRNIHAAFEKDLKPRGFVEAVFVSEVSNLLWDIMRGRRLRAGTVYNARPVALEKILRQLTISPGGMPASTLEIRNLVRGWFEGGPQRGEVERLLKKAGIDESAIDAEAFRLVALDLHDIDKSIALAQARFSRLLREIGEYRKSFAIAIEAKAEQVMEDDTPMQPLMLVQIEMDE